MFTPVANFLTFRSTVLSPLTMVNLPTCSLSVAVSLWPSISNSPQPRTFSSPVIPSLNVTFAEPSLMTMSPTYLPSMVNWMFFLNPVPWRVPELGQVTSRVSPALIFWACSSNVNLTVVCPPSVISLEETVNELMLLLTSAAFTTDWGASMNNNIGMNNTKSNFESLPLMKSFIIFPPKGINLWEL